MMKVFICALSLGVLTHLDGIAQNQEDFVEILEVICDLPEVEPLFQAQVSGGPALILQRPDDRRIAIQGNYNNELLYDLRDEELTFFGKPVKIMTAGEAGQYGVNVLHLVNLSYRLVEDEASILMRTTLMEGDRSWQGMFSLTKDFGGWSLKGKNIQNQ